MLPAGALIPGVQLSSQGLINLQMSEKTPALPVAVTVRIDKWIDGPFGRFANAKVLSPDAPTIEAIFKVKKFKTEPPIKEPFDCSIKLAGKRWQVVALASEPEPVERELRGRVEDFTGNGYERVWTIRLAPGSGALQATLTTKVLRAARFAHVEVGQELTFTALSTDGREWAATRLLTPKVADLVDISTPGVRYVCFAIKDWSSEGSAKSVTVAVHAPNSTIWPLVYLKAQLLVGQSIRAVRAADLGDSHTVDSASLHLEEASQILQSGTPEELADLIIHCVEVTLKWDAQGYWNVDRLTSPLSLREPKPSEEIEWVQAQVSRIVPAKPVIESTVVSEEGEDLQDKPPVREPKAQVWMDINDPRVGRGCVSGRLTPTVIAAAGLKKGVPLVVRLIGNPPYWNMKLLHRSTPPREDV